MQLRLQPSERVYDFWKKQNAPVKSKVIVVSGARNQKPESARAQNNFQL